MTFLIRVLLAVLAVTIVPCAALSDADALWRIVSQQCVPDEKDNRSPRPCEEVNLGGGYAVLKDTVGNTQFLLIPTMRVSGIESPGLLMANAPNYFEDAWNSRHYVDDRAHRKMPRDTISLAINAISGRTQNQLHIHIDCVRNDVRQALRNNASAIGTTWARFPVPLAAHDYLAMRVDRMDLAGTNPFALVADNVPGARADMGHYTIVVVGIPSGFVLLAGHANPAAGNWGSGEQLQDHTCAVATALWQ